MEDPVVPFERNLHGYPLAGLSWERQFEKVLSKYSWEKVSNWECLFVHREKGLFLSVYVDDIKLAGSKQNIISMWKVLNKEADLGEPTSFLDHVYLGCTQRQCQTSKDIVDNDRTMFESRISAGATEKLPCSENLSISSWSYDMEGLAKKCVERYCELANRTTQQLYKVSTPCLDDHHFKEEELKSVGELSKVCSQVVLKCIKYIDTKNQLADTQTKGNFTRDEWNHLLCLFNISHFNSINKCKAMSQRTQEDAGEERVTAKSKPMTNLVSRCRVRDPNVRASTASENPVNTKSESQKVPLSSLNVQQTGTGRPVYDKFVIDDDMDSDTAAESDLFQKSVTE